MTLLSLDLGKRRVGVAISHGILAEALTTLDFDENKFELFANELKEIIETQKVQKIIIGLPLAKDSKETSQTKWTVLIAAKIKKATLLPQVLVEEAYSSVEAATMIKDKTKGGSIDALSAKIILDQYLNEER